MVHRFLSALGLLGPLLLAGCSRDPELPPGLEDAVTNPNTDVDAGMLDLPSVILGPNQGYAPGPYGIEDGDVIRNVCFNYVWEDPRAADYDARAMQRMCLGDFYDPDGEKGVRVLMLSTVAEWCGACRAEWSGGAQFGSFSDEILARHERGLRSLALMYHDDHGDPATRTDMREWASTYEMEVPFGLDAEFAMGSFSRADLQPFNMLVDTRTMRILERWVGAQTDKLFARIEQELNAPGESADAGRD